MEGSDHTLNRRMQYLPNSSSDETRIPPPEVAGKCTCDLGSVQKFHKHDDIDAEKDVSYSSQYSHGGSGISTVNIGGQLFHESKDSDDITVLTSISSTKETKNRHRDSPSDRSDRNFKFSFCDNSEARMYKEDSHVESDPVKKRYPIQKTNFESSGIETPVGACRTTHSVQSQNHGYLMRANDHLKDLVQEKASRIRILETEIVKLKHQIDSLSASRIGSVDYEGREVKDRGEGEATVVKGSISQLQQVDNSILIRENRSLHAVVECLKEQLEAETEHAERLAQQIRAMLQSSDYDSREEIEVLKKKLSKLADENKILQSENKELRQIVQSNDSTSSNRLQQEVERNHALNTELELMREQLILFKEDYEAQKQEFKRKEENYDMKFSRAQSTINRLEQQLAWKDEPRRKAGYQSVSSTPGKETFD